MLPFLFFLEVELRLDMKNSVWEANERKLVMISEIFSVRRKKLALITPNFYHTSLYTRYSD